MQTRDTVERIHVRLLLMQYGRHFIANINNFSYHIYLFIFLRACVHVCMCVSVCEHARARMRRPEDILEETVLPFHLVGLGKSSSCQKSWWQVLLPVEPPHF